LYKEKWTKETELLEEEEEEGELEEVCFEGSTFMITQN